MHTPHERLALVENAVRTIAIKRMRSVHRRTLAHSFIPHPGQTPPAADWRVWVILAGRGFGKTRAGAEFVAAYARANRTARIALVGATEADARRVMIEGPSGLLSIMPAPRWRPGTGTLIWSSGARAQLYSATAPEGLRGPEHDLAWCDELGKWRGGDRAWDNLLLGLRRGGRARVLVTTTPRPTTLMRRVLASSDALVTRGRSADNPHLSAQWLAAMRADYGESWLGRQELDGVLLDEAPGALWTRALIEACRADTLPPVVRVIVAVDPPAGSNGDACGIVAVAYATDGCAYVVDDASVIRPSPQVWARAVAACAARWEADSVVAESNNGGEMIRATLTAAGLDLPIRLTHARLGKGQRAEPVLALYEAGRVRHRGVFPALEDELCAMTRSGYTGTGSPDRADALVWALTTLLPRRAAQAMIGWD